MGAFPLCWFEDELYHSMATRVRPATALTRRRLHEVSVPLPPESFTAFMEPLKDGDAPGLERGEDGVIKPTKSSAVCDRYHYIVNRPLVTDRLFQLAKADLPKGPWPRPGKGAWRRGHGCARANLPIGVHKKGRLAESMSMVAGNVVIEYKVPKRWRAMAMLTLRYFTPTVNHRGEFVWPAKFSDHSRALLKKLARQKLQLMLDDPEYPIHEGMRQALKDTTTRDTYLTLTGSERDQNLRLGAPANLPLRQQ